MATKDPTEPFTRIDVTEARDLMQETDVVVVDVRNQDEWDKGHVPDALFIPVNDLLGRLDELPEDKRIVFICASGGRSALAAEYAAAAGLEDNGLYNVEGGTNEWIARGYPVE
jgi:rhodanese-related sulfurtransferase